MLSVNFGRPIPDPSPVTRPVHVRLAPPSRAAAPAEVVSQPAPSAVPRSATTVEPSRKPSQPVVDADAPAAAEPHPSRQTEVRTVGRQPVGERPEERREEPDDSTAGEPARLDDAEEVAEPQPVELASVASPDAAPLRSAESRARYQDELAAWLEKHRLYPFHLRRRGVQGEGVLRLKVARSGRVEAAEMIDPIADQRLDGLAMQMVRRSDPFPSMPADLGGDSFECEIDIRFTLAD